MSKADRKKKTLEVLGKMAEKQLGRGALWPPCMGILYQPKRPKRK